MLNFCIRGKELRVKEPKSFFIELNWIFINILEKIKALEALVSLYY